MHGLNLLNSKPMMMLDGAHLSGIWEGPSGFTIVSLSALFTPFLFGSLTTAGCLPLVCILIHCTVFNAFEGALCPVGFTVRSPGSWLGGSWVSALLIVGCLCTFIAILLWCLVVVVCFLQDLIHFLNSSAHKLPCLLRARPSRWWGLSLVLLVLGVFFGLVFFFPGDHPMLDMLDCVLVQALFWLPNEGTYRTLHNSFNGTNTVLRPGESREGEGRKKRDNCRSHYSCGKERQELPPPLREYWRGAINIPISKRAMMHTTHLTGVGSELPRVNRLPHLWESQMPNTHKWDYHSHRCTLSDGPI